MSSDLLNDFVIEVPRVPQEAPSNVICVFETLEDIACDGELRALSKLCSDALAGCMGTLHPVVVAGSGSLSDMLLEDDNVGIGDFDRVGGGEERSNALVNSLGAERGGGGCR